MIQRKKLLREKIDPKDVYRLAFKKGFNSVFTFNSYDFQNTRAIIIATGKSKRLEPADDLEALTLDWIQVGTDIASTAKQLGMQYD